MVTQSVGISGPPKAEVQGASGALPASLGAYLKLDDFEAAARSRLPKSVYGYIAGSAEDGVSLRANRQAYEDIAFNTRVLVDTSTRSTSTELFGRTWSAPFGIAPMGAMGVAAFEADLAMARAAAAEGIPFVLSGSSLVTLERVMQANPEAWFQAYLSVDAQQNTTLIDRVERAGFQTLVVTVDVPVGGNREADVRNGYTSPLRPTLRMAIDGVMHPRWLLGTLGRSCAKGGMPHFENFAADRVPLMSFTAVRPHRRDNLSWSALHQLRERWRARLILKGVLSSHDAAQARAAGVDGIIVSNHGGRQLDGATAPLRAMNDIVGAAGEVQVMIDSGVRRGTDVLKAVALGARLAFIGRPFLYAAVAGGEDGVRRAIQLLKKEIDRDMALLGCNRPDECKPLVVLPSAR
ncbi:alpha-hydroxy acid oxidase [soil metagenome]